MANKFKYNKTGTETDSLFKGNWAIDTSPRNSGGGPSSTTGLYHGAPIPSGGYTIYSPGSVYTATTDDELLGKVRDLGGDWSSVSAALTWASTNPTIMILNKSFDNLVTDGLVLNLDASNISSFTDSEPTVNITTNSMLLYGWQGTYNLLDSATKTFTITTMQGNAATTSAWRSFYWSIPEHIGSYVTISAKVKWISESGATFSNITIGQGNTGTYPYHFTGSNAGDRVTVSVKPISEINMTWSGIINATGAIGFTQWINNVTQNGGNAVLQVSNIQIEAKSSATPFINGTRSATQGLLPLVGNSTIDLSNVSFDANGKMVFDGTNDNIAIGASTNYLPLPTHSLEAWIKSPGLGSGMNTSGIFGITYGLIVQIGSNGSLNYYAYNTDSGSSVLLFTLESTGVNLFDNTWHHIVCTRDSSNVTIYIDGVLNVTTGNGGIWTGTNVWASMNMLIGTNPNNVYYYFNGYIDNAKIYNKALTASEIRQNFQGIRKRYGL